MSGSVTAGNDGHRARLLERYIKSGISSLGGYEILELILTFAIPRKDTKPIAKRLMAKYGTVSAALSAPLDELCEIDGLGKRSAALLTLIKDTMSYCLNEASVQKKLSTHRSDIDEYLRMQFGHLREEYAAAVFLDSHGYIIGTEIIARGTAKCCVVTPRAVMEHAIKRGAASYVLAHNHPAGTAQPSEADWAVTERHFETGRLMDIRLVDHVIISRDKVTSMNTFERWPSYY